MSDTNGNGALPPHDTTAESGALGCVFLALGAHPPDSSPEQLIEQLSADDFYDLRNKTVFRAMLGLQFDNRQIDLVSVESELRENGKLSEVGGVEYLQTLPETTPSALMFPSWLETVRDRSHRRRYLKEADSLRSRALDLSTPAEPLARKSDLPDIIPASLFSKTVIPRPPELIEGVLHKGTKMVFGGGSKTFKTWSMLDLSISVASGLPWLEFPCVKGQVLYVNFEIPPAFFQERLRSVVRSKGLEHAPAGLDIWNLRGYASSYTVIIPQIETALRDKGYSLIILDPIYKLYGTTSENDAAEVGMLLNSLENLATTTGAAIAFGAHYSKGNQAGKESIDRISGSGVFARDPDSIVNFTKHQQESCFSLEFTLRNFKPVESFVVKWDLPLFKRDRDLDPEDLKRPRNFNGGRPSIPINPLDILIPIEDRTAETAITWNEWASLLGISGKTLRRRASDARKNGWLYTVGEGNKARHIISPEGKQAIFSRSSVQTAPVSTSNSVADFIK